MSEVLHILRKNKIAAAPVLENDTLVGIISRRDVIMGLLQALEINYEEKEISSYSGPHFFNEVIAEEATLVFKYKVPGKEVSRGGEVASGLKKNRNYSALRRI